MNIRSFGSGSGPTDLSTAIDSGGGDSGHSGHSDFLQEYGPSTETSDHQNDS